MPKRRQSSGRGGDRGAKRRRWKHLYLIIDDRSRGYSSRQVDLSSNSDPGDLLCRRCTGGERCLPPPIFRLEAPPDLPSYFAAAFGTKIMSMHPKHNPSHFYVTEPVTPNPVYVFDVRTRVLSFGRRPQTVSSGPWPMYIPVGGDRLFALCHDSFHLLSPPQPTELPGAGAGDGKRCAGRTWRALPAPPFAIDQFDSYAVHPDGRTIFVSVGMLTNATFSFHMPKEDGLAGGGWKPRGAWTLPMTVSGSQGPAHFDPNLNAWVGLSRCDEGYGHICACDVVPADPDDAGGGQPPARKLSKEKLIDEDDPAETHTGATLFYMGARSRYCLVEHVYTKDKKDDDVTGERILLEAVPSKGCTVHYIIRS